MRIDFTNETSKEIRRQMGEWTEEMFTGAKGGGADINTVMRLSPLIQMLSNELTARFVKRTTVAALVISLVALGVSYTALNVAKAQQQIQWSQEGSYFGPGSARGRDELRRQLNRRAKQAFGSNQ